MVLTIHDVFDRPTLVIYPDGTTSQMVYNRLDLEWTKDRKGAWSRQMHDALRHVVLDQDPLLRRTYYEWCTCGAMVGMVDPAGNHTTWTRDIQSRVTQKTYADTTAVTYTYENTTSRLKSSTDARGQVTNYQYFKDDALKQVSYTSAVIATPTVSYTYDSVYPRVATMVDGTGTTTYAYNPVPVSPTLGAGRLASLDGPLANDTLTYTYDELGRTSTQSINGMANTSSVSYDTLGRVTSQVNPLGTFDYTYVNTTGRVSSLTYPNGQVTNFSYFNNAGDQRLQQIQNLTPVSANLSTFTYTYDPNGMILTWGKQNDAASVLTSSFTYDAARQLLAATVPSTSSVANYAYNYDRAGNRTTSQTDATVNAGSFNNVNQLTGLAAGGTMTFTGTVSELAAVTVGGSPATVDSSNHWLGSASVTVGSNSVPVVATDPSGNATSKTISVTAAGDASRTLTYDANGNMTDDGAGKTYDRDAVDRLVKITQTSGVTEFVYDGQGRRVAEKLGGTVIKQWVWNGGLQPAEERDASNAVTKCFYGGLGEQIGGTAYFFTSDHLGSVREMSDGTGAIRARYDYAPYGKLTKVSGDLESDFGFTGIYRHSASGLGLTLYRAYDADLGRWLSRDTLAEEGGTNLYGYVGSNPINTVDPTGLVSMERISATDPASNGDQNYNPTGVWSVSAHGNPTSMSFDVSDFKMHVSPTELAKFVKGSSGYSPSMPVILLSCNTGTCGPSVSGDNNFANQFSAALAKLTGVDTPVVAPQGPVYASANGNQSSAPGLNPASGAQNWHIFVNGKKLPIDLTNADVNGDLLGAIKRAMSKKKNKNCP